MQPYLHFKVHATIRHVMHTSTPYSQLTDYKTDTLTGQRMD